MTTLTPATPRSPSRTRPETAAGRSFSATACEAQSVSVNTSASGADMCHKSVRRLDIRRLSFKGARLKIYGRHVRPPPRRKRTTWKGKSKKAKGKKEVTSDK